MKHLSLLSLAILICFALAAQTTPTVYTIKADSTKLTGCDSNELIIENHTQNVPGFLYNTGNGRTIFKHPLTKISDTFYLVGTDTLKLRNPNAWVQNLNSFGTTGKFGTADKNNLEIYVNNQPWEVLDTFGIFHFGPVNNTDAGLRADIGGYLKVTGLENITVGDNYDITLWPNSSYGSVSASTLSFGHAWASIGVIKSDLGTIPQGSMVMGFTSPNLLTAMVDLTGNPVFVVNGNGTATINGGYNGVQNGGGTGVGIDAFCSNFVINGGRGTGAGTPSDIVFGTASTTTPGTTIQPMTNRWWIKGGTGNLSNTSTPTSSVDISGTTGYSQFRMRTSYTPTSTSDPNGNIGDFSWDDNYFYYKTSVGWKRISAGTF